MSFEDPNLIKRPSTKQVDAWAIQLAIELDNVGFEPWYCGIIYQYGIDQVIEWRNIALTGKTPKKLFSYLVSTERNGAAAEIVRMPSSSISNSRRTHELSSIESEKTTKSRSDDGLISTQELDSLLSLNKEDQKKLLDSSLDEASKKWDKT